MIGLGYHGTVTPAVIRRNVLEDPSWYTAYTPYQPEISQGRLEALLNFQTMVGRPDRPPDGERVAARRGHRGRRGDDAGPPRQPQEHLDPLRGRRRRAPADHRRGADPRRGDGDHGRGARRRTPTCRPTTSPACSCSTRTPSGRVRDPRPVIDAAHAAGALAVVASDLLALTVLESPGQLRRRRRARIDASGSACPLFYGGPHAGFMAVAAGLERHLPGRLVGVSVDAEGRPAYRLALQTREQHIRRDKATSNICTAQVLLAVAASMYAVYHGPTGLTRIAEPHAPLRRRARSRAARRRASRSTTTRSSTR